LAVSFLLGTHIPGFRTVVGQGGEQNKEAIGRKTTQRGRKRSTTTVNRSLG